MSSRLVLAALLCAALPSTALAAWPHDPYLGNLPISRASGDQTTPQCVSDGAGGMIVVWGDTRSGTSDIYAQRVSAAGATLWTTNGVPVCVSPTSQSSPVIASDGAGGAIVAWRDSRNGTADVYAQRLNASGSALWTVNGVALCTATSDQIDVQIIPDGSGGAIACWQDGRGANLDVYAQRVNSAGTAQWTANGVVVTAAAGNQSEAVLVSDGAGGAIFAWSDYRASIPDIYTQRLNGSGVAQWTANGVVICDDPEDQYAPAITTDGAGGAWIVWHDQRPAPNYDIYARRVLPTGSPLSNGVWGTDGMVVSAATGNQSFPLVEADGFGGVFVAWIDARSGENDVYAQHLTVNGQALWTADGMAVTTATGQQVPRTLLADGSNGAIVIWTTDAFDGADLFAQRYSSNGAAQWTSGGVGVSAAHGSQLSPSAVSDGNGGVLAAFADSRSGAWDVYGQRVERYGQLGNPEAVITQVKDVSGDQGGAVKVSWAASYLDVDPTYGITEYRLWRSVPTTSLAAGALLARGATTDPDEAAANGTFLLAPLAAQDYAWEFVGTQAAATLSSYSVVAATTRDSIGGSNPRTAFMVEARATTALSTDRWFSAPDSGYSVDNLAPATPAPFTGQYGAGSAALHWNPNTEADLAGYRLYRGTSAAFVPGPGNLVSAQPDTGYVDAANAPFVYKLTAVDVHGNESPVATLIPSGALAVGGGAAPRAFFALGSANPVRAGAGATLRLGLATASTVHVALYDAGGRLVRTLASGARAAGEHALAWDGLDDAGRAVAPGLYFARAEAPGFALARKLVVQD